MPIETKVRVFLNAEIIRIGRAMRLEQTRIGKGGESELLSDLREQYEVITWLLNNHANAAA